MNRTQFSRSPSRRGSPGTDSTGLSAAFARTSWRDRSLRGASQVGLVNNFLALGTYRFWRDIGYAAGALVAGLLDHGAPPDRPSASAASR
ncbi:hypothetical protein ABZX95_31180 [Streptomyces sp. NPDC004232]|uniref:hypothetical protein n=1 Tax=Streptomyces sp. NPDC004232 TaxID=3154454 RepID=UPI00339F2828